MRSLDKANKWLQPLNKNKGRGQWIVLFILQYILPQVYIARVHLTNYESTWPKAFYTPVERNGTMMAPGQVKWIAFNAGEVPALVYLGDMKVTWARHLSEGGKRNKSIG